MSRSLVPLLSALALVAFAGPARADDTADAIAASQGLLEDAHVVTGLVLESLDTLEAVAGDPATRAEVAKALEAYRKTKPGDLAAIQGFTPQLAALARDVQKNGFKPHPVTGADAQALQTALVKANAAALIAASEATRAASLGQKAAGLIMANPFGAMSLKPLADNAGLVAGLAGTQASVLGETSKALEQVATQSSISIPSTQEVQALVQQLAPAVMGH